jgi:hypothetical protein
MKTYKMGRALMFGFIIIASGCVSYNSGKENRDGTLSPYKVSDLQPGKSYLFLLKNGNKLKVRVNNVDSLFVYGTAKADVNYDFKDSIARLERNTEKIYLRQFDPGKTTDGTIGGGILFTVVVVIGTVIALVGIAASIF